MFSCLRLLRSLCTLAAAPDRLECTFGSSIRPAEVLGSVDKVMGSGSAGLAIWENDNTQYILNYCFIKIKPFHSFVVSSLDNIGGCTGIREALGTSACSYRLKVGARHPTPKMEHFVDQPCKYQCNLS